MGWAPLTGNEDVKKAVQDANQYADDYLVVDQVNPLTIGRQLKQQVTDQMWQYMQPVQARIEKAVRKECPVNIHQQAFLQERQRAVASLDAIPDDTSVDENSIKIAQSAFRAPFVLFSHQEAFDDKDWKQSQDLDALPAPVLAP
jgi:hypothetical protein